jgi:hypothetical protein
MCVKIAAMVRALPGGFALQAVGVKMLDKNLVHAVIGGKDSDCGSAELSLNLVLTRGKNVTTLPLDLNPTSTSRVRS